jgi:hypothetical protein
MCHHNLIKIILKLLNHNICCDNFKTNKFKPNSHKTKRKRITYHIRFSCRTQRTI